MIEITNGYNNNFTNIEIIISQQKDANNKFENNHIVPPDESP